MKPTLSLMLGLLMLCGQGCRSNAAFPQVFVNEREWKGPGFYCVAWDEHSQKEGMDPDTIPCGIQIFVKNYTSQMVFVRNPVACRLEAITLTYKQGDSIRKAYRLCFL
jgi:hypothetical protein